MFSTTNLQKDFLRSFSKSTSEIHNTLLANYNDTARLSVGPRIELIASEEDPRTIKDIATAIG